ncbi:Protein SPT10 [Ceratocystis platani]|uniref:Protein SPT10 n=1 Tax=Ceratocystis fimbriata f. sp. platani TaxID=88771 RepID=A0A0F8DAR9_CERFI|nr:Protein SPT10 [Ceratocystis platani]
MSNVLPVQGIQPYHVFLKDGSDATLFPFASVTEVPEDLILFLQKLLNHEIIHGETYPMAKALDRDEFAAYWFSSFNGVMLRGKITSIDQIRTTENLNNNCLGSFCIKPNYPGHSNHICNGAFLVNTLIRNQGVGKFLGQAFLKWAPLLGYTNSVFNLVYESNRVSCRLWESLGFKRLGRIPRARYLKASDEPVDAIIYGYDFLENKVDGDTLDEKSGVVPPGHDPRLWRTKFYLANRAYPPGVNVREKSCLRTSAGSYKLVDDVLYKAGRTDGIDTLKKVIIKFSEQFELATEEHYAAHSGINKTTSAIAAKYHWGTIKDTVANVIEKCEQCSQNVSEDCNSPSP